MTQAQIGFLRGLLYAILFTMISYVSVHIGTSGFATPAVASVVTALLGSVEHFLNDPNAPAN
jgi:hypothetical protein